MGLEIDDSTSLLNISRGVEHTGLSETLLAHSWRVVYFEDIEQPRLQVQGESGFEARDVLDTEFKWEVQDEFGNYELEEADEDAVRRDLPPPQT